MMIDAFANHITAHLGRHLLYWAVSSVTASSSTSSAEAAESHIGRLRSINLKLSELFIKFQGPLERGVQVLDNLLTLDEADFNGYWGTSHAHSYEPEIRQHSDEPTNREVLFDNDEQDAVDRAAAAEDDEVVARARPSERRRFRGHHQHDRRIDCRRKMETLNSANGILLSPPHNNSGHLNQRHNNAIEAAASRPASGAASSSGTSQAGSSSSPSSSAAGRGASGGGGEHNIQITQPISAPSSPLGSPGAIGSSTALFCMPSAISMSVGAATQQPLQPSGHTSTHNMGGAAAISNSGSFVCSVTGSMTNSGVDTSDPNWQATKSSVLERNAAMFNNELMSDVCFKVGEDFDTVQTIPAHKYILATGSSVFYAMFYGGLAEHQNEIKVPDVEPSAFLTLLRYLYCDEIQLEPDNILATLYAAKKYIVPHLARACVNYLEVKLTAKNACLLLSQSRLFEEPELMQRCWEVIDAQPEMAIKSEDFVDIDLKTFESILSRETLNCKEIHLFEAALNWALNACQKMNIEPTPANQRSMLGQALHLIRIPTMTLEEFANGVAQTGILSAQETIDTFLHFTAEQKPSLGFPTRPRAGLKTQVCHRFQSCAYRTNQWRYRGRCDSIQFSVDRRIFIVGFGLYGSSTGAAHYNVRIELKRLGRTLAQNDTKFYSDGSSSTFHVFFDNPIQIEPECYYTASVILDGNELSFFGQEGMFEVCMGNVTFQFQCSSESTNGTGVQGGQIPELIFYGPTPTQPLNSPRNSICHSPSVGALAAANSGDSNGGILGNCDDLLTSGESAGPATNAQASAAAATNPLGQGPMSPGS